MSTLGSPTRRTILLGIAGTSLVAALPMPLAHANINGVFRLIAGPETIGLLGPGQPETPVWAYNGKVPGPELRFRQGEKVHIAFENELEQASTVHWHGLRLPNAMDGVPGLTQAAVDPGGSFLYEFDLPDAGTFWYHPHVKSSEQIGRGLYGPLIVEERTPPLVDRDVTWVLDDWRVRDNGHIDESFNNMHDRSHGGRMGNLASLNGITSTTYSVRAGERLRIRLINAANARSFALNFEGHNPVVIALDGHPVKPFSPNGGRVSLGSGQRADLIIDMTGNPGEQFAITDEYYARSAYQFLSLVYDPAAPVRENLMDENVELTKNPIAVPDYKTTSVNEVVITGGAMGGLRQASINGKVMTIQELVSLGKVWAINGIVADPKNRVPQFQFPKGSSQRLIFKNETAWPHPIHLHGHVFRIMARNGKVEDREAWTDTVLLEPSEKVEVIFVADNPGDWLLHCHVLEHHEAGMATSIRVA